MPEGLIFRSEEASVGGFQAIKKIRGRQVSITRVPGPPEFADSEGRVKDQAEIKLENVVILEMRPGEEEPELRNDEFTLRITYAHKGKSAHKNSFYVKGFIKSAEDLGKTPQDFNGEIVTLERKEIPLGFKVVRDGSEEKVEATGTNFVYVKDEDVDPTVIKEHIKGLLVGNNEDAALRALMMSPRAKQFPEYRAALEDGAIAELVDVELIDGIFMPVGEADIAR